MASGAIAGLDDMYFPVLRGESVRRSCVPGISAV